MTDRNKGSHDDNPDQAEIPGLKDQAMTPAQKKAVDALKKLSRIREERKATNKALKIKEDAALREALEAMDALNFPGGQLGPAYVEQQLVRKLKVSIDLTFRKDRGR